MHSVLRGNSDDQHGYSIVVTAARKRDKTISWNCGQSIRLKSTKSIPFGRNLGQITSNCCCSLVFYGYAVCIYQSVKVLFTPDPSRHVLGAQFELFLEIAYSMKSVPFCTKRLFSCFNRKRLVER